MSELSGLKVMVIDDAQTITRAAEIYIANDKEKKPTGIQVKTVSEGFDAIPQIFQFKPDIIFLDVMMQKVEGFTICRALKNNPGLKEIKVVMLTSKEGLFDRARGVAAGADDYITKPFTRETIMQAIAKHAPQKVA